MLVTTSRCKCFSFSGMGCGSTARNLTDTTEGFLVGKRYLIYDRSPHWAQFPQETQIKEPKSKMSVLFSEQGKLGQSRIA